MKLSEKIQEALREQQEINLSDPAVQTALRERVMDAIAEALGDAYDCTRRWSAWGYGTMSQDDFSLVADDSDRIGEIADAAIGAIGAQPAPSVPDSIIADAARYQFLRNGGAYLEPNEGEIYMATDYGAKYYKDLRDLDMDIDEAIAAPPETKP